MENLLFLGVPILKHIKVCPNLNMKELITEMDAASNFYSGSGKRYSNDEFIIQ